MGKMKPTVIEKEKFYAQVAMAMEDAFNLGVGYGKNEIDEPKLEVGYHAEKVYQIAEKYAKLKIDEFKKQLEKSGKFVTIADVKFLLKK